MKLLTTVAIAVVLGNVSVALAQTYPSRPVTMIVPFPAGGVTDIVGRVVAAGMKPSLGQPVVVENVSGAGGTIGVGRLFRATPDGYTVAVGQWTSNVGAGAMYSLPFDLLKDFEPVSMLSIGPLWIAGRNSLQAKTMKELIAWLKENPGKATAGTVGPGSAVHFCLVYFENMTGTQLQLIPYRGAAPMMQDLVAGHIDLTCIEAGQTLPHYHSGSIKAYAVVTEKRWFAAPEVPTMDEAGVPGMNFPFWIAMWAPKNTPRPAIGTLNAAVAAALADPGVQQRLHDLGHEIPPREQLTPEALGKYHKAEIEKWWPMIKAAGVKMD